MCQQEKAGRFTVSDVKSVLLHVHHHKELEHLVLSANPIAFAHDTLI